MGAALRAGQRIAAREVVEFDWATSTRRSSVCASHAILRREDHSHLVARYCARSCPPREHEVVRTHEAHAGRPGEPSRLCVQLRADWQRRQRAAHAHIARIAFAAPCRPAALRTDPSLPRGSVRALRCPGRTDCHGPARSHPRRPSTAVSARVAAAIALASAVTRAEAARSAAAVPALAPFDTVKYRLPIPSTAP